MIACSGTSRVTTAFAPILANSPTMTGPRTCAPEPTTTLFFKVGFGKKYTVNQVINLIKKKIKKKFKVKIKPNTPYDQFGIYSDNRKLITTIKYKPKYSLSEGLDKFLISKIPSAD